MARVKNGFFYAVLGGVIAFERRRMKLTQPQLARRLGVSQPTLSRIENGLHRIDHMTFVRLPRAWHHRLKSTQPRVEAALRAVSGRTPDYVAQEHQRGLRCLVTFVLDLDG